jgi:hypothetical protein
MDFILVMGLEVVGTKYGTRDEAMIKQLHEVK